MPVPPFTGTHFEDFEIPSHPEDSMCLVTRAFQNTADMCTPGKSNVKVTGGWFNQCDLQAHGGSCFSGSKGGLLEFVFDQPVSRFGGYFATNGSVSDGKVSFYDPQDALISTEVLSIPKGCDWHWNGWETVLQSTEIARVEIVGNHPNGGFAQLDDLQVDQIPDFLSGSPDLISLSTGGTQSYALNAGSAFAGMPYLLLGSMSGTDPGIPLDGLLLPLNADAYLLQVLIHPNTPPLSGSFGNLDAEGKATASFTLPPGLPLSLLGAQFDHAYLVIELTPTLLQVVLVSNSISVVVSL